MLTGSEVTAKEQGRVTAHVEGSLGVITLDRRGKHNALTLSMWSELGVAVTELAADDAISAIAIRGANGSFSAGADLTEVLAATAELGAARRYCETVVSTLVAIASAEATTIAAMDGIASGGGVEVAIAADHRIVTPRTSLQLPFGRLGVVPDRLTLNRLVALTGTSAAGWMMLKGEPVDAAECFRLGLVDHVVSDSATLNAAVGEIAAGAAHNQRARVQTKRHLRAPLNFTDVPALAAAMVESFVSGEVETAARRFLSKT